MDINSVQTSYARWAPIYDTTFGTLTRAARRRAVKYINSRSGHLLEVGVGTGLALKHYKSDLQVTGIDFSDEMLDQARRKLRKKGLSHVKELRQMDARTLDFPTNSFDMIVAMHVLSVVPEPQKVMAEIARVCKPGGQVIITNHFAQDQGTLGAVERLIAPFADTIGWHSDFEISAVLQEPSLKLIKQEQIRPLGIMTFLVLEKTLGN